MLNLTTTFHFNHTSDYRLFEFTRHYIQSCSKACCENTIYKNPKLAELAKACNYNENKLEKFATHRKSWDRLNKDIPLVYLKEIGVDMEKLKLCQRLDWENYEYERTQKQQIVEHFIVKKNFMWYEKELLPIECQTEEAAVNYVNRYLDGIKASEIHMRVGDLKRYYFIRRDNQQNNKIYKTVWFEPLFRITKAMLIFEDKRTEIIQPFKRSQVL